MSISEKIRAQIISSFRAELSEHVQTLNEGLLAIEQNRILVAEREERMATIFRAAHSLKGAARAVGVSAVEQLAHALEDILGGLHKNSLTASPALFTACYKAVDAIQVVEAAYEAGETTPPMESLMALSGLEPFRRALKAGAEQAVPTEAQNAPAREKAAKTESARAKTSKSRLESLQNALADSKEAVVGVPASEKEDFDALVLQPAASPAFEETIRVGVGKLNSLMEQLNELLVTKIRAGQRLT